MANMVLLQGYAPAALTTNGTAGANLLTPDPKEVWLATPGQISGSTTVSLVDLDYGVDYGIDTIWLGHTNAVPGTQWYIVAAATQAGLNTGTVLLSQTTLAAPSNRNPPRHGLWMGSFNVFRWWRVVIVQPTSAGVFTAGVLMLGKRFQPVWNREAGDGRRPIDLGAVERLRGGGFGRRRGAIKLAYEWVFGDLTDTDLDRLAFLISDPVDGAGQTDPVLVIEDPDNTAGLAERMHYGLFTGLDVFERTLPGVRSRWRLSMEEWT